MLRVSSALLLFVLGFTAAAADLPLQVLKLPEGFEIAVFADNVPGARSMARSEKGTLFVSTRTVGDVYAVIDADGDYRADKVHVIATKLNMPNGVAIKDGALYVAEVSRVTRYDGIEDALESPPAPVVVIDTLPTDAHHGWKYMGFGPDGKLYMQVGAPCNICDAAQRDPRYASIIRMNADGTETEVYAHGVRNSVGFTWHPITKDLWFTDNGRDMMGDNVPPCELNRATAQGQHFGYPYCHGAAIPDPEFGAQRPCTDFVPPVQELGPHVAPLGLRFYTGEMFPSEYRNQILIAEHGSWNRSIPIGYRVTMVRLDENGAALAYEPFIEGWLQRTRSWGRPVDLLVLPDGSLLVSDDQAGVIYRVTYKG